MKKLSKLYHIGSLKKKKSKPTFSFEGNGLSVSLHPDAWTKIAQLGGDCYLLTKDNPNFLTRNKSNEKKAISWALKNKFIKKAKKFRSITSNEDGEECYSEHDSYESAIEESEEVISVNGYSFDVNGISYWENSFNSPYKNSMAAAFAIIFYAEAMEYDGVYWNEILDIPSYSAPRGVIFQNKIKDWKITKLDYVPSTMDN